MTVLDTSAVVDLLLGIGAAERVTGLLEETGAAAAPDIMGFEVIATLRRLSLRGEVPEPRLDAAIADLGDLRVELFPTLPLRHRAWSLRRDLTVADALFVTLAEQLGEPLATKDSGLADAAERHTSVRVHRLA